MLVILFVGTAYLQRQNGFTGWNVSTLHATDGTAFGLKPGIAGSAPTYTPAQAAVPGAEESTFVEAIGAPGTSKQVVGIAGPVEHPDGGAVTEDRLRDSVWINVVWDNGN